MITTEHLPTDLPLPCYRIDRIKAPTHRQTQDRLTQGQCVWCGTPTPHGWYCTDEHQQSWQHWHTTGQTIHHLIRCDADTSEAGKT